MLKKNPAGFPAKAWDCQRLPVESKKDFIWEHIKPKRVGIPKRKASPSTKSLVRITGMSLDFGGAPILARTDSDNVSGT